MKAIIYQNLILTIIAGCLIVITFYVTGVINYSYEGRDVPIEISSVSGQRNYKGGPVVPVEVSR